MAKTKNNVKMKISDNRFSRYLQLTFEDRYVNRSDAWLNKLADALLVWCDDEDSYSLQDFFWTARVDERVYYLTYLKQSPALQDAHKWVLKKLGARREVKALKKELDSRHALFSMPLYNEEWKELHDWHNLSKARANLKAHEELIAQKSKEAQNVVVQDWDYSTIPLESNGAGNDNQPQKVEAPAVSSPDDQQHPQ